MAVGSGARTCEVIAEERAQATVEMAVVTPVLLVMALIVYNLMVFASATARFDRIAPDIVLAHGVAPSGDGDEGTGVTTASIQGEIAEAMGDYDVEVEVSVEQGSEQTEGLLSLVGAMRSYRCEMRYRPWPSNWSIAGVSLGAPLELAHVRDVVVDPWRSGVVV